MTCQKAKKWLDANDITYTERHIKDDNPSYEELKEWYEKSGLPLKKFFNTSGMLYKSMELKDKLKGREIDVSGEGAEQVFAPVSQGNDAVDALVVLGYSRSEATKAVASVSGDLSVEDTIKAALIRLMKQ